MQRQEQMQFFITELADSLPADIAGRVRCVRSWPVLASIVLHGVLFFLILFCGVREPVGVAGVGRIALSFFEVGLGSLPNASGLHTAPLPQGVLAEAPPEQKGQSESPAMPEDAIPLHEQLPVTKGQQATRALRAKQPQRPQQVALASRTQGEQGIRTASLGGIPVQPTGESGLDALATRGSVADDGNPFGFSLGEVNGKPKVVKRVPVVYPVEARKKGIIGQVLVRFHLDEKGTVSHLHIKNAEPPDIFNQNALVALMQWRFQPAIHNNRPVPVWVELPLEFHLRQ